MTLQSPSTTSLPDAPAPRVRGVLTPSKQSSRPLLHAIALACWAAGLLTLLTDLQPMLLIWVPLPLVCHRVLGGRSGIGWLALTWVGVLLVSLLGPATLVGWAVAVGALATVLLAFAGADAASPSSSLEEALADLPAPTMVVDVDGNIRWRNDASNGLRPADPSQAFAADHEVMAGEGSTQRDGEVWLRADGEPRCFRVVRIPLQQGLLRLLFDDTDRAELERRLSQSRRLETLGQLTASIAHEINTPIQFVGDNVRFLEEMTPDLLAAIAQAAAQHEHLASQGIALPEAPALAPPEVAYLQKELPAAIRESMDGIKQIADIVANLKGFAHPGRAWVPTDANEVVRSVATMSRSAWRHRAELHLDLDGDLPPIEARPGELKQAMLNLVINACDALLETDSNGQLWLRTRQAPGFVVLECEDNGKGMPEHVQRRIFEPFFTTKSIGHGTGQGLSLVHAIVTQQHQGTVEVFSTEGQGTRIVLTLPLHRVPQPL